MSKRKAGVNDIIYELDNDDVESSSDDDGLEGKKLRGELNETVDNSSDISIVERHIEVVEVDSSNDAIIEVSSPLPSRQNGGKTMTNENIETSNFCEESNDINYDNTKKEGGNNTEIFNEDIVIDSSDESDIVVGCENRKPLVTVMFNNKKVAKDYKKKIKKFMLNLIKLHDNENLTGSESETDLELDIWPEDLINDEIIDEPVDNSEDNLFFVDTAPEDNQRIEIPQYSQSAVVLANNAKVLVKDSPVQKRGPSCFNCDGEHQLRDCQLPRNHSRIFEKRKAMNANRVGRYHVEDDQKFGHIIPGRISGQLRHALGLRRDELPVHIYRMRLLGYPPGWLQEARISHSGITMFDSTGQAILEPEEEDGEVVERGSRDQFDIKKIIDFPGFNVPASSRYKEDGHRYNLPPMSEDDSKMNMLQVLAPNAMKAYKRKKLMLFPSAFGNDSGVLEGQAEMEIDYEEEEASFPSVPPLPDEAPPAAPPPPPPPPESPPSPPDETTTVHTTSTDSDTAQDTTETNDMDAEEVIDVEEVETQTGVEKEELKPSSKCGRISPTLADLEEKKRLLIAALGSSTQSSPSSTSNDTQNSKGNSTLKEDTVNNVESTIIDEHSTKDDQKSIDIDQQSTDIDQQSTNTDQQSTNTEQQSTNIEQQSTNIDQQSTNTEQQSTNTEQQSTSSSSSETPQTPKQGHVKSTSYGTPVLNVASPYSKLPSDDKFSKDICDVINFENLPDSTGKYKKISNLLKRVKSEVDRIQDS